MAQLSLDVVQACVEWLDYASAVLNPERALHHALTVTEMQAFLRRVPPPPPALQERWSTQLWALPGEPYEVYLLRCLAHHSAVTLVSPHFALHNFADNNNDGTSTAVAAVTLPAAQVLERETCVVVGVRVEPSTTNLLQTGWDVQSCPYCINMMDRQEPSRPLLPFHYGGDTCASCRHALPLTPAWTRVLYLVLERRDRRRTAAVAYGAAVHRFLSLGARVEALLYTSVTEQRQPLLVVHAARPARAAIIMPVACDKGDAAGGFHCFYVRLQADQMAQKWTQTPAQSLVEVARSFSPKLLGQEHAKGLVLLVLLHTLYEARHTSAEARRRPLHLLLVGPAKTGKTALLRAAQQLMGTQADVLDLTVVRGGGARSGGGGASFLAALPTRHRDLCMAGPALTATTLVLDHLPAASTAAAAIAPLQEVLERGRGSIASSDADSLGGAAVFEAPVHLLAAAEEESATAVQLAPHFAILAPVSPTHSLGESALISQDVVAASRARSSQSRSASRSSSIPTSARSSPSQSQQRASVSHSSQGGEWTTAAAPERLTAEDMQHLISRTAAPAVLAAVVSRQACYSAYGEKLMTCASLVEEAQPPPSASLPPAAATRGRLTSALHGDGATASAEYLALAPLRLQEHLRVLRCLSQARLMLETADAVRRVGWTAEMQEEVWQLYACHLVTLADLLQGRRSRPAASGSACELKRRCGAALTSSDFAFSPEIGAGAAAGMLPSPSPCTSANLSGCRGPTVKKVSKRKCRLAFLQRLKTLSVGSGAPECIVSSAAVEQLYAHLGGSVAFGDPLDVVVGQLQEEGLLLRRPGGWRVA